MATCDAVRGASASFVHAASIAGFLVVLGAVAVTAGPLDWASWRRAGLGWRFWMAIANLGAATAFGSLVGCAALSAVGRPHKPSRPERIGLCAALDLLTIFLLMFVPAVAARW